MELLSRSSLPLVTVSVPTRNRARSLRESIRSICGQDYRPLEIVISDNASEDETEHVCGELVAADDRIRYVRHPRNIGLHGNHNFCLAAGAGEFLCVFHDHDRHDPRIISKYVDFLRTNPKTGVVCSDWELINDSDARIGFRDHNVPAITPGLDYIGQTIRSGRSSIGIPGAMVRRSALGNARFIPDAPIGFGDFPLWFQVAERSDVGHISERLWSWRQNKESHSARTIEAIAADFRTNLERYCDEHLSRWPQHGARVGEWRRSIRRYLFWALAYEVSLHFRPRTSEAQPQKSDRSLFEIMDYCLSDAQFQHAMDQMRSYRTSPAEHLASLIIETLVRIGVTFPLGWAAAYQASLRGVLRLK